jgi:DNA helicase II / ATP-dependent DNA helicase PcrA
VNVPARWIGDASLERLQAWAAARGTSLFGALVRAGEVADLPRGAGERTAAFAALVERYRAAFRAGPIGQVARRLVEEVDLHAHARATVKSAEAARRKVEALEGVLRSIELWEQRTAQRPTLPIYLAKLALDSREDEPEPGEAVTLMTLHAAKGLEFPVVFLVGVEEDLLPVAGMQGETRDLDEERRLAYVGMTRARERLVLTRAATRLKRGKLVPRTPSRFLQELPPAAVVAWDPSNRSEPPSEVAARSAEVLSALRARFAAKA